MSFNSHIWHWETESQKEVKTQVTHSKLSISLVLLAYFAKNFTKYLEYVFKDNPQKTHKWGNYYLQNFVSKGTEIQRGKSNLWFHLAGSF